MSRARRRFPGTTLRSGFGAAPSRGGRRRPAARGMSRSTPPGPARCYPLDTTSPAVRRNGPCGPIFFDMATTYDREKELQTDIAPRVEHDLPGVEVLAVELAS